MLKLCFIVILLPFSEGIFGGEPVKEAKEFPFLAKIRGYGFEGIQSCVGTILSKELILTSGHCVNENLQYFVTVGDSDWTSNQARTVRVSEKLIHPEYDNRTNDNDIALLRLEEKLNFDSVQQIKW